MSPARQVIKVVAPKRAALAAAEEALEVVMVGLRAKQAELQVGPRRRRSMAAPQAPATSMERL
jgi:hypothetical protein